MKENQKSYGPGCWKGVLLFGVCMGVLFIVYGLYGLPYGPAIYTGLLCTVLCGGTAVLTYGNGRKREWELRQIQKHPHTGTLPSPQSSQEDCYQQIIQGLRDEIRDMETKHREALSNANQYYTLWTHQIKTPLSAMRLLLQEDTPDKSALEQERFKMEQYVQMVLQYQRLGADSRDLDLREYSIAELVRHAVKRTATLFIYKKITLDLGPLERTVVTDAKWMGFILEQLFTNAVKYTSKGTVSVYLSQESPMELVIADTGIGIRPEDLPRVTEWGYTGYNGRMDQRSTGIGLNLCKQALDMLGHQMRLESQVGKGTKVFLDLSRESFEIE